MKKLWEQALKEHQKCKCGNKYHKKAIKFYKQLLKKEIKKYENRK